MSKIAYERIRDEIINWQLPPKSPLVEADLSQRFDVSRTPVREALSRLASEGLVSHSFGRTAIVTPMEESDIRALFETRCALECRAVRLACGKRDVAVFEALRAKFLQNGTGGDFRVVHDLARELDETIDETMDNTYILNALNGIRGHLQRARRGLQLTRDRLVEANTEHLLIIDAIIAGDAPLAENATVVHLHRSLRDVLHSIRSAPQPEIGLSCSEASANQTELMFV